MMKSDSIAHSALSRIAKDDLLKEYKLTREELPNLIFKMISTALSDKKPEALKTGLLLCFVFDINLDHIAPLLSQINLEDWHGRHEDIAILLKSIQEQQLRTRTTI